MNWINTTDQKPTYGKPVIIGLFDHSTLGYLSHTDHLGDHYVFVDVKTGLLGQKTIVECWHELPDLPPLPGNVDRKQVIDLCKVVALWMKFR